MFEHVITKCLFLFLFSRNNMKLNGHPVYFNNKNLSNFDNKNYFIIQNISLMKIEDGVYTLIVLILK